MELGLLKFSLCSTWLNPGSSTGTAIRLEVILPLAPPLNFISSFWFYFPSISWLFSNLSPSSPSTDSYWPPLNPSFTESPKWIISNLNMTRAFSRKVFIVFRIKSMILNEGYKALCEPSYTLQHSFFPSQGSERWSLWFCLIVWHFLHSGGIKSLEPLKKALFYSVFCPLELAPFHYKWRFGVLVHMSPLSRIFS